MAQPDSLARPRQISEFELSKAARVTARAVRHAHMYVPANHVQDRVLTSEANIKQLKSSSGQFFKSYIRLDFHSEYPTTFGLYIYIYVQLIYIYIYTTVHGIRCFDCCVLKANYIVVLCGSDLNCFIYQILPFDHQKLASRR